MWSSWSSVAGNLTQNLKQLANDAFEEMSEEEMAAYEKEVAAVRRAEFDLLDPADQVITLEARLTESRDALAHSERKMQALTLEFQAALLEKDIQMKKLHLDNARAQSVEQATIDLLAAEHAELELAQSAVRAQLQQLAASPDQPRPATPMSSDSNEAVALLDAARDELVQLQQRVADLERQLAECHRETALTASDHKAVVEQLRWRCQQSEEEVELQRKLAEAAHQTSHLMQEDMTNRISSEQAASRAALADANAQIESLKSQLDDIDVESLQTDLDNAHSQIESLESELADARTHEEQRVAELQTKHDEQCKRLEAVEEEYDELISELRSEHSTHCSKLESELAAALDEIEVLKTGSLNHESMASEVQSLQSAAVASVQQHQDELKRIAAEHQSALQQQCDDSKQKIDALMEEHARKMAELQQSLDSVNSKLATQQQANEASARTVRQQQDECDSLRQQLTVSAERAAAEQQRMHSEALQLLEKLSRAEAAATSSNQLDLVSDQATELMTLRTRVSELQMQLSASDNQHADVVAQLTKQAEAAAKAAAEALESSTAQLQREQQDALAIRSELDAAKQTIASLTEAQEIALKHANEAQAKAQLELDQANAALNQSQVDHQSALNSWNEERGQVQKLQQTLEDQVRAAQSELSALQSQLALQSSASDSQTEQISSLSTQVSALQSQCSELQTMLIDVSAEKSALESNLEALESARSQSASASEHELVTARQQLAETRNEADATKTSLLAAQAELEASNSKARELEEQLAEVSSELEQSRSQHRSVQAELLAARSEAEQVQSAPASVAPSDQDALDGEAARSLRAQLEVSRLQATKAQEMAGIAQADLAAALVKHAAEAAAAESKISLLVAKEREWIEWNVSAELVLGRVMVLIRQWIGAAAQTTEESVSAEDLLSVVEASHESIMKKLSDGVSNATALRRAEEQLKTVEHSREAHDVNRDALLKQLQSQYESVVKQLAKVQADARDAFAREDAALAECNRARADLQRAHRECETMRADLERAMFRDATATDERDVRLSECEAELADALQQLEAAEERIAAVHADAARKEHHATAAAQAAAGHVDALEREAAALRAELTMSTRTLSQQHDESHLRAVEASATIAALKERIQSMELDMESSGHLVSDLASVRSELDRKQLECDQHALAVQNLHVLCEQLQTQIQDQQNLKTQSVAAVAEQAALSERLRVADDRVAAADAEVAKQTDLARQHELRTQQVEAELLKIRSGLASTVAKVQQLGGDEFTIDRRMVTKLIVTYFEQNRAKEVLELISKILQFTDREKEVCGLGVKKNSVAGVARWVGARLPSFVQKLPGQFMHSATVPSAPLDAALVEAAQRGEANLADLWVNFLLSEASAAGAAAPNEPVVSASADVDVPSVPSPAVTSTPVVSSSPALGAESLPPVPGAAQGSAWALPPPRALASARAAPMSGASVLSSLGGH